MNEIKNILVYSIFSLVVDDLVFFIIIILIYLKERKGGKLCRAVGWGLIKVVFGIVVVL
jgi:hypothetical protein